MTVRMTGHLWVRHECSRLCNAGKTIVEFEVPDNYNPVRQQILKCCKRTRARNERVQRPRCRRSKEEISKLQCLEMMV